MVVIRGSYRGCWEIQCDEEGVKNRFLDSGGRRS